MSTKVKLLIAGLLAVIVAVVFLSLRSPTGMDVSPLVDDTNQVSPPGDANSQAQSRAEVRSSEPTTVEEDPQPVADLGGAVSQEPLKLFSEPRSFDASYRDASDQAAEYLNSYNGNWSRNVIVQTDRQALRDLVNQVESNDGGLQASFDVSPYGDVPCILSSVDYTTPRFKPNTDTFPDRYMIFAPCESSTTQARISVDRPSSTALVTIVSPISGSFHVMSLGETEYSLAFRVDDASAPRRESAGQPAPGARIED